MKKSGFTLAELLISLGIVGVIAAVTLPLMGKIMPDVNKAMYLKAHDSLQETVLNLVSTSSVFSNRFQFDSETQLDIKRYPLLDTKASQSRQFGHHAGATKLCKLLAESFGATSDNCSAADYVFSDADFNNKFNRNLSFTSSNGMEWWIIPKSNSITEISDGVFSMNYQTDVYVDVNSSTSSKNCIYNADSCKNPDRFKFMISADGTVVAADPVGEFYNANRAKWTKKKGDIANGDIMHALGNAILTASIPISGPDKEQGNNPPYEKTCTIQGKVLLENGTCSDPNTPNVQDMKEWEKIFFKYGLRSSYCNGVFVAAYPKSAEFPFFEKHTHLVWNPRTKDFEVLNGVDSIGSNGIGDHRVMAHVKGYSFTNKDGYYSKDGNLYKATNPANNNGDVTYEQVPWESVEGIRIVRNGADIMSRGATNTYVQSASEPENYGIYLKFQGNTYFKFNYNTYKYENYNYHK